MISEDSILHWLSYITESERLNVVASLSANNELRVQFTERGFPKSKKSDSSSNKDNYFLAREHQRSSDTLKDYYDNYSNLSWDQYCYYAGVVDPLGSALDIIKENQESKKTREKISYSERAWGKRQKPKKFSKFARHRILEAGSCLDRLVGFECIEITLTIPGGTDQAMACVADWSGYIMNRLNQIIRDHDLEFYSFYVWEFQRRGALHLHFLLACPESFSDCHRVAGKIEDQWFQILLDFQCKVGIDCFQRRGFGSWRNSPSVWQSHIAVIEKSVSAYFSKYCSKDSNKIVNSRKFRFYPSRWWGMSRNLCQLCKDWEYKRDLGFWDYCNFLEYLLRDLSQYLISDYQFQFDIKYGDYIANTGFTFVFYFDSNQWESIHRHLKNKISQHTFIKDYCRDYKNRLESLVIKTFDISNI